MPGPLLWLPPETRAATMSWSMTKRLKVTAQLGRPSLSRENNEAK